jgi:methylthioribose-1-phosphate isomerase
VANKIGTYLKALAAFDNHIPFYVAVPSSSIDFQLIDGVKNIKIEERGSDEMKFIKGLLDNKIVEIQIGSPESPAVNFGFDVTPARLVSGLITERGICKASENEILNLFPEYA